MRYKFFDSLTHIKADESWYNTDKKSSCQPLINSYENGEIAGAVLTSLPDDNFEEIAKIVEHNLPFVYLICSIKSHWLDLSFTDLCTKLQNLKIRNRIIGIKIHPRFSGISLENLAQLEKILSVAKHLGLLVYICTIFRRPVGSFSKSPHTIIRSLLEIDKQSDLDIVLLHGGYTDLLATSEVVRDYSNAWLDLSFTFMRFRKTSLALDVGYLFETLDKRSLIGTDYPECTPRELVASLEYYVFSRSDLNLDENKIQSVLHDNMQNLVNKYAT
jgi:hypothetical protein